MNSSKTIREVLILALLWTFVGLAVFASAIDVQIMIVTLHDRQFANSSISCACYGNKHDML
jgi:hypothetical protein